MHFKRGKGDNVVLNVHNDRGISDLNASLDQMSAELPNVTSMSLVVTWFGDDLRCDRCTLKPLVEQAEVDGDTMPWIVSGLARNGAEVVSRLDGRPVFGGTPADASVQQAIAAMRARGQSVMFYPFILMDIQPGNGLDDPWTGAPDQPPVPWRGRITLAVAPGRAGTSDKTAAAADAVAGFFGQAAASDFYVENGRVLYSGPEEWSYRRFVLHYAHLCALSGGVDAFCIGSELRSLTQIRNSADGYPAVRALCTLAQDVRSILGPDTKIGYAADWSEYFGHQPNDGSGDVLFHMDPLWALPAIDFVGIDNYMPLSDWRDGTSHADAAAGSIYDLEYLKANVAGGEGFDWYYPDAQGREAQNRIQITDGTYGEPWVFRYKDLVNWWSNVHVNRIGGVKVAGATAWQPGAKPIWFTELGCPAVDKGTNQPNVFHDPKSSESFFPYFSTGARDDFIQYRYLQAMLGYWNDPANNPISSAYSGSMVDMARCHVWAWDARPWPDFPARSETWADGSNYAFGHWLNGRMSSPSLGEVVTEVCARCDLGDVDVSRLHGGVTGYLVEALETGRQSLQPLMLAFAFDCHAIGGELTFASRSGTVAVEIEPGQCVATGREPVVSLTRSTAAEMAGRVTVAYVRSDLDYLPGAADALAPDASEASTDQLALPITLSEGQASAIAERSLSEGRIAQETLSCGVPPSMLRLTTGDLVSLRIAEAASLFRIDRIEEAGHRSLTAVRMEPGLYDIPIHEALQPRIPVIVAPAPVEVEFLDLPLLSGSEDPVAPYVAVARVPWTGPVAVYSAANDYGYSLDQEVRRPAVFGSLLEALPKADVGLWTRRPVRVRVGSGSLQSRSEAEVLNGANVAALRFGGAGDWEIIQFCSSTLVAPNEYLLSGLLRGQCGSDGSMPDQWPVGTDFVLLDGAAPQVKVAATLGQQRHFRVGPTSRSYDDPSYVHTVETLSGAGLRPYRPAHFKARRLVDGAIELAWIRRTRIDGDSWLGTDVPLGEEREAYLLRMYRGDTIRREIAADGPTYLYSTEEQAEDYAEGGLAFEVAQVSSRYGPGPFERIDFDG